MSKAPCTSTTRGRGVVMFDLQSESLGGLAPDRGLGYYLLIALVACAAVAHEQVVASRQEIVRERLAGMPLDKFLESATGNFKIADAHVAVVYEVHVEIDVEHEAFDLRGVDVGSPNDVFRHIDGADRQISLLDPAVGFALAEQLAAAQRRRIIERGPVETPVQDHVARFLALGASLARQPDHKKSLAVNAGRLQKLDGRLDAVIGDRLADNIFQHPLRSVLDRKKQRIDAGGFHERRHLFIDVRERDAIRHLDPDIERRELGEELFRPRLVHQDLIVIDREHRKAVAVFQHRDMLDSAVNRYIAHVGAMERRLGAEYAFERTAAGGDDEELF